ncbi:MAG TPA: PorP/SprF family type IX secretion system membrane protein [Chitinophagales bacterium]|nr:PorP/SprF family type IX secretion system membrane protein [Chitinophagales bacterium]
MRKILFGICMLSSLLVCGQDVHFSQFFAAPMHINPAQTGNFLGSVRLGANYRDQWGSVTVPYRTFSLFTDVGIQPKKAVNRFGLGVIALNDQAGDGVLTTNKLLISAAYHIGYTDHDAVRLAIGLQGGIVQKTFDVSRLYFDNQWNDFSFDQQIANGETGLNQQLSYADLGAGALLTIIPYEDQRYTIGASVAHVNEPVESFYGSTNQVGIRYTATAGAFIALNGVATFQPQIYVSTQKKASEIILGANFSKPMGGDGSESALFAGTWFRVGDALWVVGGLQTGHFTGSISYDINVSKLSTASNLSGGLEMAVVYTFGSIGKRDPLKCPTY